MNYYGNPMTRLIEELAALPGIGGKSAQRLAFHIINLPREKVAALSEAILAAKDEVKYCSVCCNLTEEEICPVCANPKRDHSVIMVVEDPEIWRRMNGRRNSMACIMCCMEQFLP